MRSNKQKKAELNRKVLIIDDEPDFTEAFRKTLEANEYQVSVSSSRPQAQQKLMEDPSIIVLGTIEPAGEAFQMHQWLKAHPRYKNTPLLVIDARYTERYTRGWRRFEGMQLQADEFMAKPVEPALLIPRIQSLLEEAFRKIRVLVVDDHTMVRDGICAVLSLQDDIDIAGEAVDGVDAMEKAIRLLPNVTLMDIMMPGMNGLEATRLLSRECPQTKVLILTQYSEEENMRVAKQAGAYGFIPKHAASSDLVTGIKTVYAGRLFPSVFAQTPSSTKKAASPI